MLPLLLCRQYGMVLPSCLKTFRRPSERHCACAKLNLPSDSFVASLSSCTFVLLVFCMLLLLSCTCPLTHWWGRGRPVGFPCSSLSLMFVGAVKVRRFRPESWLRCRTSGCKVFPESLTEELSVIMTWGRPNLQTMFFHTKFCTLRAVMAVNGSASIHLIK